MKKGNFLRAKFDIAIFEIGRNLVLIFLQFKRRLNLIGEAISQRRDLVEKSYGISGEHLGSERGDVPGWVLVVLMTTGLVTAIWTIAAPRLSAILRNSLDAMNGIR